MTNADYDIDKAIRVLGLSGNEQKTLTLLKNL
jgi:hypothetical protein